MQAGTGISTARFFPVLSECPISKNQCPTKSQGPNPKQAARFWFLGLGHLLVIGTWVLRFSCHGFPSCKVAPFRASNGENRLDLQRPALSGYTDQSLLTRLHNAEARAFDELIAQYQPAIASLASRLLGWRADVDDVVQDVFFAAYRSVKRFRGDCSIQTWLMRLTLNQCRSRQRRRLLSLRWLRQQAAPLQVQPSLAMEQDEISDQVRLAMQKLRPADREILVLYYLEDRSGLEISELFQTSPAAVDVRLHRARAKLKEYMQKG